MGILGIVLRYECDAGGCDQILKCTISGSKLRHFSTRRIATSLITAMHAEGWTLLLEEWRPKPRGLTCPRHDRPSGGVFR